jgi:arylsulfatase A-like enzyme
MNNNILFIVADDLNAWIGALGRNPDVKTPNIDKLARRGALFVNAYCSAPYCNASRMGVFTGRLPSTTGIYHSEPLWDKSDRPTTFIERLREQGYYTFGAGKVFHGVFDYARAGREGAGVAHWTEAENRPFLWDAFVDNENEPLPAARPLNGLFDFADFDAVPPFYHHFDWGPLPAGREAETPDERVCASLCAFLRNPPKVPFFCAGGFYKPHLPWHAPQRFFDLYDPDRITLPAVKWDDLDDVPPIGRDWALSPRDHELVVSHDQWRPAVRAYLAAISYVDCLIGRVLDTLDATGLSATTSVILWGDNGFHLGEKLHWRKFALWEESTRVPLIIASPDAEARRIYEPVSLLDIFPTVLRLSGATQAPESDGVDLTPCLSEGGMRPPRPVITTWGRGNHSVRWDHWRYTLYSDGGAELYDHAADPGEWTNLAAAPRFAPICSRLKAMLPRDLEPSLQSEIGNTPRREP